MSFSSFLQVITALKHFKPSAGKSSHRPQLRATAANSYHTDSPHRSISITSTTLCSRIHSRTYKAKQTPIKSNKSGTKTAAVAPPATSASSKSPPRRRVSSALSQLEKLSSPFNGAENTTTASTDSSATPKAKTNKQRTNSSNSSTMPLRKTLVSFPVMAVMISASSLLIMVMFSPVTGFLSQVHHPVPTTTTCCFMSLKPAAIPMMDSGKALARSGELIVDLTTALDLYGGALSAAGAQIRNSGDCVAQAAASCRFKTGTELVCDELREGATCLAEAAAKLTQATEEAQVDSNSNLASELGALRNFFVGSCGRERHQKILLCGPFGCTPCGCIYLQHRSTFYCFICMLSVLALCSNVANTRCCSFIHLGSSRGCHHATKIFGGHWKQSGSMWGNYEIHSR